MDNDKSAISLRNITKAYGNRTVLKDVSLEIGSGVTGLLGPNGCGKSTMIKSMLGLLKIKSGQANVLGYQLPGDARRIRDAVGYVPEDDCFIAGLTGIESVSFLAQLSGLPATEGLRRSHEVLDFADIGGERYRPVEGYSTGMRQKLKFAQAIVGDPQLLILDEPTTGLDPQQRVSFLSKIRNLAVERNKAVLISTHILTDVKAVCDSVVIMSGGRIHMTKPLDELMRPARKGVQVWLSAGMKPDQMHTWESSLAKAGLQFDATEEPFSYWIHDIDAASIDRVWQVAEESGVLVQRVSQAKNSLEQVFFDVVKEADNAAA